MDNNYCGYCDRHFKFKDLYDQHMVTCDFFHKKKKARDREVDCIEKLPSQQEMYKLVQHIAVQCNKLQKEVEKLKANSSISCKKAVLETLNSPLSRPPLQTYQEWIKSFSISTYYLERVFKENITEGIKLVLSDRIKKETKENIPIRSFKQKPTNLYIYSQASPDSELDRPYWRLMSVDDYDRMINLLLHQFIVEFTNWQDDNCEVLESSEKEKDKNIMYMMKIHNIKTNEEKQKLEIRKWIYSNFENDLNIV